MFLKRLALGLRTLLSGYSLNWQIGITCTILALEFDTFTQQTNLTNTTFLAFLAEGKSPPLNTKKSDVKPVNLTTYYAALAFNACTVPSLIDFFACHRAPPFSVNYN